jgi:SAM-dependent MidA family methyltransferase
MGSANRKYYSSKGKGAYSDFSTFAQGRALAKANAVEFVERFGRRGGEIAVCEYGVGDGNFSKVFLDEVKKRDSGLYGRVSYHLFDLSEKMLAAAKKTLARHRNCSFSKFDAASKSPLLRFDYCRINELLSDLPAEIYFPQGGRMLSFPSGKVASLPERKRIFVEKFLARVEEGRAIPFPFIAQEFLVSLCSLCKDGGAIDVFDYGFYSAEDTLLLPMAEWNRLVARVYGKQITVDLNFLMLSSALSFRGISHSLQPQKAYCERMLGKNLQLSHAKSGLDYVPARSSIIKEDDGFYYLRIEK